MTDGTALTGGTIPGTVLSIDAMGGDEGPSAVVGGMEKALEKNPDLRFIVHGDRPELERLIETAPGPFREMRAAPRRRRRAHGREALAVLRHGKDTSMWSAIEAVRTGEAPVACPAATPAR
jgi:phosphate acyltransferase